MIIKKIKSSKIKSKAASIRDLADYIRVPEKANPAEKVMYAGGRGFICDSHAAQREEMIALAAEAVRSKNPVNHYIMSWREGEQPSPAQIEEAISIFMEELGVQAHQAIYALHKDTDNLHLHIVINRVHPYTLKCVEINRGFDIDAAHRAIARIEHDQGWQREQNGRYQVLENGELGREHNDPGKPRHPDQRQRDMEHRTGAKSAERIAIEEGAPIIKRAQTWEQLHHELSRKGMRYEKTGSGATLFVGEVGVKASSADRAASLSKLQKRLGPYQPPPQRDPAAHRTPEPIKPDMPGWKDYITGRQTHYAEKNKAKLALDTRQAQERNALAEQHKRRREKLLLGNWKGNGEMLNAMRSVIAAEQAAEKAALKEKHRQARAQHRQQFRPYPDLEQWQRLQHSPELAEQWRHRAREPQRIEGDEDEQPTPRDIRAYQAKVVGQQVHYTRREAPEEGVSFVDKGKQIDIYQWRNRDTTLAALQLSAQKWGWFTVTGNDEYKAMCANLAAEHGFRITNPELQESIQQARRQLQQARAEARKSEQLKEFERYAAAVGAARYRVTCTKLRKDGSKQTFILDKQDGITKGFTPQEIEQRTPALQALQRRGEDLYYTPLSDEKHHILIDELNREKLDRLRRDGYRPAAVLESSPGNYQAIITVQKLGMPHDRALGDGLAKYLNREYGNYKLSDCIQPHRAPGYENLDPKRQGEDGSHPVVRVIEAERRECAKTQAAYSQIDAEYQQLAAAHPRPARASTAASDGAIDAYQRHYFDVRKRQRGKVDLSRVDSMIAVRMRVTGHNQTAIMGALRDCAPGIRGNDDQRDWNDYAQRTARYAFSAAGDRQASELVTYRQRWERLERREPARQTSPREVNYERC